MSTHESAPATRHALKEWAVAIQALRQGDGMITVRKGGIREDAREFRMEHRRFAFFPTYEHQNPAQLQPAQLPKLEAVLAEAPPAGTLRIDTWAEVTDWMEVREQRAVAALSDFYVFSEAYALERLQWRHRKPLHVLLLRVYRLQDPLRLELLPEYGGCKSWIDLAREIPLDSTRPALDDSSYEALRARALHALRD